MFTRFKSFLGIALVGCVVIGASVPVRGQAANIDISIGGGPVFVDDINGLQAKVDRSGTYTYTLSISSSVSLEGASLGFRLYSPDASIGVVSHEAPGRPVLTPAWQTAWTFGVQLNSRNWDGNLPDTFLTGGIANIRIGGFGPIGPTDIVTFTLTFPGVDGIVCVDSTFFPPASIWLATDNNGFDVGPSWGGGNGPY
ncbi:MAG: hypothetical protein IH914_07415, partial [candidate division Zixibacteria bacterium]|nr:hypothetical protein [candidate division Zixibacteria bacterium]